MNLVFITYVLLATAGNLAESAYQPALSAGQQIDCFNNNTATITDDNWQTSLRRWSDDLQKEGCFNPSSAFAFIEVMNNYESEQFHAIAERFYFKALNATFASNNFALLEKETRKIMPLLSQAQQKKWEAKIKRSDPTLKNDIKLFWILHDPVLTTDSNERLTEHWERISYARRHFTKNTESVYKADDRAKIYVQLGPPTSIASGLLTPEPTDIRSKLYDISSYKEAISSEEMFRLNISIRQHYMPRKYEIWIYENLTPPHRILYMFGKSGNTGKFGLRKSVEEFVPNSTFNTSIGRSWHFDTGPRGLIAGPFLQAALYSMLSTVDIYFGQQLLNYDSHWNDYLTGDVNFTAMNMQNNRIQAETALRRLQDRAPDSYSTLKQNLRSLNHSYLTYRFLNSRFEPVHKILVFVQPAKYLLKHDSQLNAQAKPEYRIDNVVKITDTNADTPVLLHNLSRVINSAGNAGYMLDVPDTEFHDPLKTLQLGSEIKRYTKSPDDGKYRVMIIASEVSEISPPAPLQPNGKNFMVSDLIWGYQPAAKNHNIDEIAFAVPADEAIPSGKNLNLYFEAYHMQPAPDSLFAYQLEYEIKRVEKRTLVDRGIKLNLSFEAKTARSQESLEIDTSRLEPGHYRALFRFGKKATPAAAWIERTFDFHITK